MRLAPPAATPPRTGTASLWPCAALLAVVTVLMGAALRAGGFAFDPWRIGVATVPTLVPWILGALLLRTALHRLGHGAWPAPTRSAVARQAPTLLAAFLLFPLLVAVYCWGKILTPYFRPVTYDAQLYALDVALHFGLDVNRVLLAAFEGAPWLDAFMDWSYALYPVLLLGSTAWFLTQPDPDDRHRYLRGFFLLWLGGLALYWAVPALGPVYVFEDLIPLGVERFPRNAATQLLLLKNHQGVDAVLRGQATLPIRLELGIAAMPSLHVALPAYAFAFTAERGSRLRVGFLVVTLLYLVASVLLGWHYAIDGYAGIGLAAACWLAVRRPRPAGDAAAEAVLSSSVEGESRTPFDGTTKR